MAISSEIEKLERRWQQTSGLVFAPLAEAYRKAGLHTRALEVLEQGLALHPSYGPALIVRGRCHLDTNSLAEAEESFHSALARDPMDPIALRGMADVLERTGRTAAAMERLHQLVDIDPRNADARQMLARLEAPPIVADAPAVADIAEPALVDDATPGGIAEEPAFEVVNLSAEETVPALPEVASPPQEDDGFRVENLGVEPIDVPEPSDVGAPEPVMSVPAFVLEDVPAPPEDVAPITWTPATFEENDVEAVVPETVEHDVAMAQPVAEEPIAVPPVEAEASAYEPVPPEPVAPEHVAAEPVISDLVESPEPSDAIAESEPAEYPSVVSDAHDATQAEAAEPGAAPVDEHPAIITESMAELFLKQGHRELALAVYRQVAERNPEGLHVSEAIARLEADLAPPAEAEPRRRYAAADTGGRSVSQFLKTILAAEPPASSSTVLPPAIEPLAGEPTKPVEGALPLSAVFGDEPAVPPAAAPPAADAEPSYDEFFGAAQPAEQAAASGPHNGEAEDLRQFNEWLKGLKR